MLVNRQQTVCLSFISQQSSTWSQIESEASIFQKDYDCFHILLEQQKLPYSVCSELNGYRAPQGVFWFDISPYRVTMTMQSNNQLSYRHFWETGIYGTSKYCLNTEPNCTNQLIQLRNFTRHLKVEQSSVPKSVRIEYEVWSGQTIIGSYLMHLQIG